ncbi:MAG: hypothetical protein II893_05530 [Methanomicrobium sp.]|nr:hypothetical protein [Methanomicrobium sp.]MBQ3718836.1 hypothetical protein [Methanomicrobium sp.]MBQ4415739.1 hypothetical protein [Methanomicrobium sp.]
MIRKETEKKISKGQAKAAALISAIICITASALAFAGHIDGWLGAGIVVVAFPVFVLSLFMVLRESTKDGDYPFVGY